MRRITELKAAIAVTFLAGIFYPNNAFAQVKELRFGIAELAEDFLNIGIEVENNVENSVMLTGEVLFEEPEFLKWAFSPQPYLNAGLNLEGNTSFGGGGLLWRQNFGEKVYGNLALGFVAHNGTTEIDLRELPQDTFFSELQFRRNNEREFGARILFREQLTLGYRVSEKLSVEAFFEHVSNGGIIGRDKKGERSPIQSSNANDGADIFGIGFAYGFD